MRSPRPNIAVVLFWRLDVKSHSDVDLQRRHQEEQGTPQHAQGLRYFTIITPRCLVSGMEVKF